MSRANPFVRYAVLAAAVLFQGQGSAHAEPDLKTVRLAIVNTTQFSGLIDSLLADFQASTGLKVTVYSGSDLYDHARAGEADIVISHYGKAPVERFVLDGYGSWPRTVFSNQAAIIGPKSDPAHIRGMTSGVEAFSKIASAKAPFIANDLPGVTYLTSILWESSGEPDKSGWYLETGVSKGKAIQFAEEKQGYVIFGALPFLRYKSKHNSEMEIMVGADPLLQRVMAITIVNAEKVPNVNTVGAKSLQTYLLSPKVQAKIAAYRSPGSDLQLWWPAGRNNSNAADEGEGGGKGGANTD
jgi:tungstate transport system substrate-binding protein